LQPLDLLDESACPREAREKRRVLLLAKCLSRRRDLVEMFSSYAILCACPERNHINVVGFKLFGLLSRASIEEVAVLTPDGSMHCVQLHYVVEELARAFGFRRRHMVVERGSIVEVPLEAVKTSRFLSRVAKLLARLSEP